MGQVLDHDARAGVTKLKDVNELNHARVPVGSGAKLLKNVDLTQKCD